MLSDKLIRLLLSFSKPQMLRFRKYLISPFFNENEHLVCLFDLIEHSFNRPKQGVKELKKELVWKELFGSAPYKDARMRRLCSDLTQEAIQFLSYLEFKGNPVDEQIYALKALNQLQLSKHFIGVLRQARGIQQKIGYENSAYHYARFKIEDQSQIHLDIKATKGYNPDNIGRGDYHLDCFYLINKLRHYSELLMWKNERAVDLELNLPPGFLNYIKNSIYFNVPAIAIQYRMVRAFLEPEEEDHFYQLKKLLATHNSLFNKEELRNMYLTAQNYCAFQGNLGKLKFYKELFELYKILIEKGILLSKGKLAPGNYKNIITIGLKVGESEWVENFIKVYTDALPRESQDNDRNYNLAKVYFHQKDYGKVIEQLREVEYKSLGYAIGGRLMLLETYYELREETALDSLIDSFRIFLRRNQTISRDVRQQYLNVLRFVKKLATTARYNKSSLQRIRKQIEECKVLAAKKWLLEKVKELE